MSNGNYQRKQENDTDLHSAAVHLEQRTGTADRRIGAAEAIRDQVRKAFHTAVQIEVQIEEALMEGTGNGPDHDMQLAFEVAHQGMLLVLRLQDILRRVGTGKK